MRPSKEELAVAIRGLAALIGAVDDIGTAFKHMIKAIEPMLPLLPQLNVEQAEAFIRYASMDDPLEPIEQAKLFPLSRSQLLYVLFDKRMNFLGMEDEHGNALTIAGKRRDDGSYVLGPFSSTGGE